METPILELKEIGVIAKDRVIVRNINLSVRKGELIALIGESGSGKSTVLRELLPVGRNPAQGAFL